MLFSRTVNAKTEISAVENGNGTITVTAESDSDYTLLALVENTDTDSEAKKYYYKLDTGICEIVIPLSEGKGEYRVKFCRMLSDNRAVVLNTLDFTQTDKGSKEVFENPNVIINYEKDDEVYKKTLEIIKDSDTDDKKVKAIYNYIIKNYTYDYDDLEKKISTDYYVPSSLKTYREKTGICYDIAGLCAAMLRIAGIDTKVVTGYTTAVDEYHAWIQVYDKKASSWYTMDPTSDMCHYNSWKIMWFVSMKKKEKNYSEIYFRY